MKAPKVLITFLDDSHVDGELIFEGESNGVKIVTLVGSKSRVIFYPYVAIKRIEYL